MKNKKLIYILLPLVIIIWGIIFYRIFKGTSKNQYEVPIKSSPEISNDYKKQDSFQIYANYKDPFLRELHPVEKTKQSQNKSKKQSNNKTSFSSRRRRRTITKWPDIYYKGTVKNQEKTRNVFLVQVKNKSYLAHPGDTLQNVVIKNCYQDSIIVSYEGKKKTIEKEHK